MKRTGPSNPEMRTLIANLKKDASLQKASIWSRVAHDLEKPTRQRRVVNLSRLNRYTAPNETVLVPGKVLGSGLLEHGLIIAALAFSQSARERIEMAKGRCLSIEELLKQNPQGKNIKVIG